MLYLLHGSDITKSIDKANKLVKTMLSKKPNASYFKINEDNFNIEEIQEFVGGQGLFENKYIVLISRILDNSEIKDSILDYIPNIKDSDNIFIWIEGEIDKKTLKVLEEASQKSEENNLKNVVKKPFFNVFALSDAIGGRDKKKAWILYQEALDELSAEEVYGTIFWQVKSMLMSIKTNSPAESGLKPFVYNKAKTFTKNYKEGEVEEMSSKLITLYHESRRGKSELPLLLERFILEI